MDFQHELPFTLSAAELQQCLEAYTALSGRRRASPACRSAGGSSPPSCAGLPVRALQHDVPLPERGTCNTLTQLIRKTLADAVTLFGAMRWYDGFKRIDILAWLLEEHAPKGLQGWHVFRRGLRPALHIG